MQVVAAPGASVVAAQVMAEVSLLSVTATLRRVSEPVFVARNV